LIKVDNVILPDDFPRMPRWRIPSDSKDDRS
jgi:hypothetical protein